MTLQLSIITINLNNREGLTKTLASVHDRQTFRGFEHIVIDGGSTDGSVEALSPYATRLAHWESQPDSGIYHAMNKGIARARGDYLLFLNSGDWLVDDILQAVFADFPDGDIVYGNLYFCKAGGVMRTWIPPDPAVLDLRFFIVGSLPHQATLIRRTLLAGRGYSEDFQIVSDRLFFLEAYLRRDVRFTHLNRFISYFAPEGISSHPNTREKHQQEVEKLLARHFNPAVLPFIQNQRMFHALLRGRQDVLVHEPATAEALCRWNDVFFFLNRYGPTRAALRTLSAWAAQWEARRKIPPSC